jgi:hypothetical protein
MWRLTFVPPRVFKMPDFTFGKQRAKCEACKHHRSVRGHLGESLLQCSLLKRGSNFTSCFDMRQKGSDCGPRALKFEPK